MAISRDDLSKLERGFGFLWKDISAIVEGVLGGDVDELLRLKDICLLEGCLCGTLGEKEVMRTKWNEFMQEMKPE